ncbi:phytanoyl-CoA dioxygenase family protein [Edaphocola flava]|uniref:phytanoyl-CoA dioxygenase family protein n=1 Tax=Edaphocola flava TaxID=2499629 RepID=UPI00100AB1DC|nr:phytanoyl-CoA dioxygenase family protein [Edaphocola flava]
MNLSYYATVKDNFIRDGHATIPRLYTDAEICEMIRIIDLNAHADMPSEKTQKVFAIRQCLKKIPELTSLIYNNNFKKLVQEVFGKDYFIVKSIYFDKPEEANWFVAYHQDMMITVAEKTEIDGYGPWSNKPGQYTVQPPVELLERMYTVRIHLDDTDAQNGALKVISGSHIQGVYRPELIDWNTNKEVQCFVPAGGAMLMKPLLLHSSARSIGQKRRRVLHIELSNQDLPQPLEWSEKLELNGLNP